MARQMLQGSYEMISKYMEQSLSSLKGDYINYFYYDNYHHEVYFDVDDVKCYGICLLFF